MRVTFNTYFNTRPSSNSLSFGQSSKRLKTLFASALLSPRKKKGLHPVGNIRVREKTLTEKQDNSACELELSTMEGPARDAASRGLSFPQ